MNATETLEPAIDTLQQGAEMARQSLRTAGAQAADGLRQGKEALQGAYRTAAVNAGGALQHGKSYMREAARDAASGAENLVKLARTCVERNPWLAVFGTLGIGFTLGFLSAHRQPTFQQRLANDPVNALREALHGLSQR